MNLIDSMTKFRSNRNPNQQAINREILIPKPIIKRIDDCPICMEPIDNKRNVIITKCNHQFCSECLLNEMNNRNTCPICRTELKKEKKKPTLSDGELRNIVIRNIAYMPDDHLNIVNKVLPLLRASKIPDLFEENVNILNEIQSIEENIFTSINLFGYYLASEIRDKLQNNDL